MSFEDMFGKDAESRNVSWPQTINKKLVEDVQTYNEITRMKRTLVLCNECAQEVFGEDATPQIVFEIYDRLGI